MASQPDQRPPDPEWREDEWREDEWREDEQLPDEPSVGDNRLRRVVRKAAHAGAAVGDVAIEMLSNLIP